MTNWTDIGKPTGTGWTDVPNPDPQGDHTVFAVEGTPIGLLLALTYSTTTSVITGIWTDVNKAMGTPWTDVPKAT